LGSKPYNNIDIAVPLTFITLTQGHRITAQYPGSERDAEEQDETVLAIMDTRTL